MSSENTRRAPTHRRPRHHRAVCTWHTSFVSNVDVPRWSGRRRGDSHPVIAESLPQIEGLHPVLAESLPLSVASGHCISGPCHFPLHLVIA